MAEYDICKSEETVLLKMVMWNERGLFLSSFGPLYTCSGTKRNRAHSHGTGGFGEST